MNRNKLPAFVLVLMRRVAELVIDLALKDERFFATASAEGVLIVCAEKKNHHNGGS